MVRKINKYTRLCLAFKEQSECKSVEPDDIWQQSEEYPWINSHPWSERGVPKDFSKSEFSVQRDMREEFARVAATYDRQAAQQHNQMAEQYGRLLDKQAQMDMDYLLKQGSEQEQRRILRALNLFYEKNIDDPTSPYYDTRALGTVFYMSRTIELYLERGYQAVYGPRNF